MRNLLKFIVKHGILLLFLVLEAVSVLLIFRQNSYQKSSVLTSANRLSASMLAVQTNVIDYFSLRGQNTQLVAENEQMKNQIEYLQNLLEDASIVPMLKDTTGDFSWADKLKGRQYVAAKVANITTTQARNYITLDKGENDNIREGMGVVSADGVVGVVQSVSAHYALVIPILHPDLQVSCKFKKNNYLGSLEWKHRDEHYSSLQDIARHVDVAIGDTILTSGHGQIFPENVPVGLIEEDELRDEDAFHQIKVRLNVNFRTLRNVYIISNAYQEEQKTLEQTVK